MLPAGAMADPRTCGGIHGVGAGSAPTTEEMIECMPYLERKRQAKEEKRAFGCKRRALAAAVAAVAARHHPRAAGPLPRHRLPVAPLA